MVSVAEPDPDAGVTVNQLPRRFTGSIVAVHCGDAPPKSRASDLVPASESVTDGGETEAVAELDGAPVNATEMVAFTETPVSLRPYYDGLRSRGCQTASA